MDEIIALIQRHIHWKVEFYWHDEMAAVRIKLTDPLREQFVYTCPIGGSSESQLSGVLRRLEASLSENRNNMRQNDAVHTTNLTGSPADKGKTHDRDSAETT